jgi:hypothetical protein
MSKHDRAPPPSDVGKSSGYASRHYEIGRTFTIVSEYFFDFSTESMKAMFGNVVAIIAFCNATRVTVHESRTIPCYSPGLSRSPVRARV